MKLKKVFEITHFYKDLRVLRERRDYTVAVPFYQELGHTIKKFYIKFLTK